MLFKYFGGTPVLASPIGGSHQRPDRSGLPSAARGAGAERFGLGALTFSHCARAGAGDMAAIPAIATGANVNLSQPAFGIFSPPAATERRTRPRFIRTSILTRVG